MNCIDKTVTPLDLFLAVIKKGNPNYSYHIGHFNLDSNGNLLYWNLKDIPVPTSKELLEVTVIKKCPETCLSCISKRIKVIEEKLSTL